MGKEDFLEDEEDVEFDDANFAGEQLEFVGASLVDDDEEEEKAVELAGDEVHQPDGKAAKPATPEPPVFPRSSLHPSDIVLGEGEDDFVEFPGELRDPAMAEELFRAPDGFNWWLSRNSRRFQRWVNARFGSVDEVRAWNAARSR